MILCEFDAPFEDTAEFGGVACACAPTTWADMETLYHAMRMADKRECVEFGWSPWDNVRMTAKDAEHALSLFIGGELAGILAFLRYPEIPKWAAEDDAKCVRRHARDGVGGCARKRMLWYLSTRAADRHPIAYCKATPWAYGVACRKFYGDVPEVSPTAAYVFTSRNYRGACLWMNRIMGAELVDTAQMPGGMANFYKLPIEKEV